jgi:hypothetical protein
MAFWGSTAPFGPHYSRSKFRGIERDTWNLGMSGRLNPCGLLFFSSRVLFAGFGVCSNPTLACADAHAARWYATVTINCKRWVVEFRYPHM